MLKALILVCSLTVTPDLKDCVDANAVSVMRLPEEVAIPGQCLKQGTAYLAQTEMGRLLAEDERVKVVCVPAKREVAERPLNRR
ncbi:MAG TPA: hypothetical protein VEB20_11290 [Azospirillaceae bacterium]|nr:hypothetical protein [Azospirillaceae bacterium]